MVYNYYRAYYICENHKSLTMEKWQLEILDKVAHAGSLPKDISLTREQIMKQLGVNPAGFLLLTKEDLIARSSPDADAYTTTHRWENLKIAGHYHALLTMEHKEIPKPAPPATAPEREKIPVVEAPKAEPVPVVTVKNETAPAPAGHHAPAPAHEKEHHASSPGITFKPGISEKVSEMDMVSMIGLGAAAIGVLVAIFSMMQK